MVVAPIAAMVADGFVFTVTWVAAEVSAQFVALLMTTEYEPDVVAVYDDVVAPVITVLLFNHW